MTPPPNSLPSAEVKTPNTVMKRAEDWNLEYTIICANCPTVHGQLLPNPQNIEFIRRVQNDALLTAQAEIKELRKDKERLDASDKFRWTLSYNQRAFGFTVQETNQVVGNIASKRTLREAIDAAITNQTKERGE